MAASAADIRGWLADAEMGGARWLVIKCDDFENQGPESHCCYPVPLNRADDVKRTMENGDVTREVYDLALPTEPQLSEARAWHPPEGVE